MATGVYIRVQRDGRWFSEDIAQAPLQQVLDWLGTLNRAELDRLARALLGLLREP